MECLFKWRIGCSFSILYDIVKEIEYGLYGIEEFVDNDFIFL